MSNTTLAHIADLHPDLALGWPLHRGDIAPQLRSFHSFARYDVDAVVGTWLGAINDGLPDGLTLQDDGRLVGPAGWAGDAAKTLIGVIDRIDHMGGADGDGLWQLAGRHVVTDPDFTASAARMAAALSALARDVATAAEATGGGFTASADRVRAAFAAHAAALNLAGLDRLAEQAEQRRADRRRDAFLAYCERNEVQPSATHIRRLGDEGLRDAGGPVGEALCGVWILDGWDTGALVTRLTPADGAACPGCWQAAAEHLGPAA